MPNPSAARRRAMLRPMPRDAPATIAVFFMVVLLLGGVSRLVERSKKKIALDVAIRPMHSTDIDYACNAATPGGLEPSCCVLGACRRAQRIPCRQAIAPQ